MKLTKINLLAIIIAIMPLAITLFLYNSLPELIPIHWNLNDTVTYGNKSSIIILSSIGIICTIGLIASPKLDPKRKNYILFIKYFDYIVLGLSTFLTILVFITLSESINPGSLNVSRVVTFFLGVLIASIGNYLPKIKDNFFIGIKTPWSLSSTEVWNKAHRLGGFLFFSGGLCLSIASLLINNQIILFSVLIAIICFISLIPSAMSYIWYRKIKP